MKKKKYRSGPEIYELISTFSGNVTYLLVCKFHLGFRNEMLKFGSLIRDLISETVELISSNDFIFFIVSFAVRARDSASATNNFE
jgi:hypothetical protein